MPAAKYSWSLHSISLGVLDSLRDLDGEIRGDGRDWPISDQAGVPSGRTRHPGCGPNRSTTSSSRPHRPLFRDRDDGGIPAKTYPISRHSRDSSNPMDFSTSTPSTSSQSRFSLAWTAMTSSSVAVPRGRSHADAVERDVAECVEQIGDRQYGWRSERCGAHRAFQDAWDHILIYCARSQAGRQGKPWRCR